MATALPKDLEKELKEGNLDEACSKGQLLRAFGVELPKRKPDPKPAESKKELEIGEG